MATQEKKSEKKDPVEESMEYVESTLNDVLSGDLTPEEQRQVLMRTRDHVLAALDEVTDSMLLGEDDLDDGEDEDEDEKEAE